MQECHAICDDTQRIVETLLALARLESGAAAVDREIIDVSMLLEQVWQPFQPIAVQRRVEVEWDVERGTLLNTDANQFRVLLTNLFDNAISYVDGGGQVRVRAAVSPAGLEIRIENTGCRLASDQASLVFERFWRGDASRGETGRHAGLGLALCQRIAVLQQASIEARVEAGRFVVSVQFPRSFLEHDVDREDIDRRIVDRTATPANGSAADGQPTFCESTTGTEQARSDDLRGGPGHVR
jgi:signal transduction histidine kinase